MNNNINIPQEQFDEKMFSRLLKYIYILVFIILIGMIYLATVVAQLDHDVEGIITDTILPTDQYHYQTDSTISSSYTPFIGDEIYSFEIVDDTIDNIEIIEIFHYNIKDSMLDYLGYINTHTLVFYSYFNDNEDPYKYKHTNLELFRDNIYYKVLDANHNIVRGYFELIPETITLPNQKYYLYNEDI